MVERSGPTVKELMVDRILSGSTPGKRRDPYSFGLVIGSGGMSGVIPGGEVTALQSMRALNATDRIYSNSSAAWAALYWASGQASLGTSIYYQDLNGTKFIDAARIFGPKPIMDVPYLINVLQKTKQLDAQKIIDTHLQTHTYVASAMEGTTIDFRSYSKPQNVFDTLSWTMRLPVIAGMPVKVDDKYYMDGASFMGALPFLEAVKDGCTHIAVLLSRPMGTLKEKHHFFEHFIVARLRKDFPEAAKLFGQRLKRYEENLKEIRNIQTGASKAVQVMVFEPTLKVRLVETRKEVLIAGARDGYNVVFQAFKNSGVVFDNSIQIRE